MGADQIATIRPALVEMEAANSENKGRELCVTFEVSNSTDLWVQVVPNTVNAAYPHSDNPLSLFRVRGLFLPDLSFKNWEPMKFITFGYRELDSRKLASLVDGIFTKLLGCNSDDYSIDVKMEWL